MPVQAVKGGGSITFHTAELSSVSLSSGWGCLLPGKTLYPLYTMLGGLRDRSS